MSLRIATNVLSLTAQRHLHNTQERFSDTIQRLASGSRIIRAADDPAGLAISEAMNAEIRSMHQAMRNAQDAISLIQVFEGGTNEISNMIVRLRELSIQAASDTLGPAERRLLQNEVGELKKEITRVARTTQFAGLELLAGTRLRLEFQVGTHNDPEIDRITFDPGHSDLTTDGLKLGSVEVTTKVQAQESLEQLDDALTTVNELRARIGASQNRLVTTVNSQGIFIENLSAARSRIRDADMAVESTQQARDSILRQAGVAVLSQANETPALALRLIQSN